MREDFGEHCWSVPGFDCALSRLPPCWLLFFLGCSCPLLGEMVWGVICLAHFCRLSVCQRLKLRMVASCQNSRNEMLVGMNSFATVEATEMYGCVSTLLCTQHQQAYSALSTAHHASQVPC